ncbi:XNP [Carabus blaptoides fortunei]
MSWKLMNMLNLYQNYVYIPKYSYQTIRLLSSKELSFIKGAVNQDILLQSLKSASSTDNILELVSTHHKIMNNKQLMQALRSLFILQKSGSSNLPTKEIMAHADFKTLCVSLKYHIRAIELNETIEALKILSYVGIPSRSTIFQTLMQMIRQNVNNLTLQQIIFLDFLLKQVTVTPLSDALLIALPIVFEVQLPYKMDGDNFSHLTDLLQYATRNKLSDKTVNHLLNALERHKNKMDVRGALSIVWSLCDLKQNDSFAPLLKYALNIVVHSGEEIKISDLETTLTKLTFRYNAKYAYYFNREYFDLVAEHTVENDLGYQQAIWILQKFTKVGHTHTGLLDYISTLCHTDHTLVSDSTPWNMFILVSGFAGTDYRPRYWESIRQGILENENLYKARRDFNWIKFTTRLAMLDLFIPRVLEKAFRHEYVEKIVQDGVFINCLHLLTLFQTISTLHLEYSTLLPTVEQINTAIKHVYKLTIDEYRPLHAALERGFGDKSYVLTNVTTKLGHILHHVVVMRKGGYPVAFKDQHGAILLEDLCIPADSHIVAIYGCEPSYYKQDSANLKNLYNLMFKTVEALGCSVVPISVTVWTNMPDYEKIPYLMAQYNTSISEIQTQFAMEEDTDDGPKEDLPQFISATIRQLINLKTKLSEAEFLNTAEQLDVNNTDVINDVCVFADKVNVLIDDLKTNTDKMSKSFHTGFKDFKKKRSRVKRNAVKKNSVLSKSNNGISDTAVNENGATSSLSDTEELANVPLISPVPVEDCDKSDNVDNVSIAPVGIVECDELENKSENSPVSENANISEATPATSVDTTVVITRTDTQANRVNLPVTSVDTPTVSADIQDDNKNTPATATVTADTHSDSGNTPTESKVINESKVNIVQHDTSSEIDQEPDENVNNASKSDDESTEDKPKFGVIKCIDINKLLDPKIKDKTTSRAKPNDNTIILLSSSDSESEKRKTKTKDKNKRERRSKHTVNLKQKTVDSDNSRKSDNSSSDTALIRTRRKRDAKAVSQLNKTAFEHLKQMRRNRLKRNKVIESSLSSDDSSSGTNVSLAGLQEKSKEKNDIKTKRKKKLKFVLPEGYDYKNDVKFKCGCFVSLPTIAVDRLKENYLLDKEQKQINRLTNMKTLKRNRQQRNPSASGSSDSDTKNVKKRSRSAKSSVCSESDGAAMGKIEDLPLNISTDRDTYDEPPIPDDLLASSDGQSDNADAASDNENKTAKDKTKSKKKDENSKKDSDSETMKKHKKREEKKGESDKEKSKWRNDKLLRGKLDATDSDEELIRFRNKKEALSKEAHSEEAEDGTVVTKKRKTKKVLRRIARRLGSDSDLSSDSEKNDDAKSNHSNQSEYKAEKKASSSSDSEEEEKEETDKKKSRRRIKRVKDSDGSSDETSKEKKKKAAEAKAEEEEQSTRKKIRNVWNRDSLAETTKQAAKEEEERKKRIAERQKLYNDIYVSTLNENAKIEKLVLDFDEETKEELLSVDLELVSKLKPHQAKGVQFMWTACFESLERAKTHEGSGCILAHCMGLGKTLQVITLIHTLLTNTDRTNIRTVMVVCPLSTVLNWVAEFKKWLDDMDGEQVNVFDLVAYKQNGERLYQLQDWMKLGGVLVIGYDMFRNLSSAKGKRMSKKLQAGFTKTLLEPGPDLVICDEGHLLKNSNTGISIAMNKLKTLRRIVLTGTPLQNNLKEYFCMVQFVKPNLLGTYKEYLNRFVNPITNGQYTDSTQHDIQIMRRRAHVLHKMLDGVVERRDYNVLAPFLPPKHEYVLFVQLTSVQCDLYKEYLDKMARKGTPSTKGNSFLFQDFQELQRICIHPRVLLDKSNQDRLRRENDDDSEGSLKDFINDDSEKSTSSNDSSSASEADESEQPTRKRRTRANPGNAIEDEDEPEVLGSNEEWWSKFCQNDELDNISHSSKLSLLFDILHQCELIGDKVLVFSQSLYSLNLIEYFLAKIDEATQAGESLEHLGGYPGSWSLGLDYFRLDGSASCDNRATWCKSFNNEKNTRARLFLISTRAGGLGINLVSANRVIIFDVSWNPSYDIQSIYRVYRFGQTKPCYIYRFVTLGTMENKIYERQVTKQAISKRVIDEQQIDRHYNQNDLNELYIFEPVPDEERPTPLVPKDRLFADLLQKHDKHIFKYHEHNSLLENKADEGLNEEERQAAWEEFENEKKAPQFSLMQTMVRNGMYETLRGLVQDDNAGWTPAQINNLLPIMVQKISEQVQRGDYSMYRRVEERHQLRVMEQRRMQMIYQQYIQQMRSTGNLAMVPDASKFAQLLSTYNQLNPQAASLPQQRPAGSSAVSFAFNNLQLDGLVPSAGADAAATPAAAATEPVPHPAVSGVVELND